MTIREIPKSYEYTCDGCGVTHIQEGAGGHYTNSTPPGWLTLKAQGDALCNSLGGKGYFREKLLCSDCALPIIKLMDWESL